MANINANEERGGLLDRIYQEAQKQPMLSREKEAGLSRRWREEGDHEAKAELTASHMRLVNKISRWYSKYGVSQIDLIQEGNIALMKAAEGFSLEKGARFSTYAEWWIKGVMRDYVMRNSSLVYGGSSDAKKNLFFNMRKLEDKIAHIDADAVGKSREELIAEVVGTSTKNVVAMIRTLGGDSSLNAPVGYGNDDDAQGEWLDYLADNSANQEEGLIHKQEGALRSSFVQAAMAKLNDRERDIFQQRRLSEDKVMLKDLAKVYGMSRERIRQIEVIAFEKVSKSVKASYSKRLAGGPQI